MNREFNVRLILKIEGSMLLIESIFLLSAFVVSLYFGEPIRAVFLVPIGISVALGLIGLWIGKNSLAQIGKREGGIDSNIYLVDFYAGRYAPVFTQR